jgi:hypothetical protein
MAQLGPRLLQVRLQMGALGLAQIPSQLRFEVLDALP